MIYGRRIIAATVFLLYRKLRFRKAKKIICPAERPLRVLGDGRIENGRRVTAKPFSCYSLTLFML